MKSLQRLRYGHMASQSSKKSLSTGMPTRAFRPCHVTLSVHNVGGLICYLCVGMPAHPAPATEPPQLPRPQPSKQPQKDPSTHTRQLGPSDAFAEQNNAPAAPEITVNPCFASFFPAPKQPNGGAAPAAKQASQELGPPGRQCSSAAEEQRRSQKAAAAPGAQERANGRTESSNPHSQADSAPGNSFTAAQPEALGTHAQPPQQCPPLFPDARGPRTVLDLMPKDWDRPFNGWACAYDASLGISHASQAYIRKLQWLRHRRPSMRLGAPQAQLRFSSWEVSFSSHGSWACLEACARQCTYADCGAVGRRCRGCASMGGLRLEHTYPAMRSWPRGLLWVQN